MIEIRTLDTDEDVRAAGAVFRTAMVGLPPLPETAERLSEPGRTLGAVLDGDLVGAADSYTSGLVVPGGARVPHAAVTHVGVLPSHTRRGVLTALLRRQLADIAERGEVVASLRASEAVIYERFGFGVASSVATVEVASRRARLRDSVPDAEPVRLVDPASSWKLFAEIYATAGGSWTGAIDRPEYWWRQQELRYHGPGYAVVHGVDGFARYHPLDIESWFTSPQRSIVVDDLVAGTPQAWLGLVRHLLSVDLVDRVIFGFAPVDSPLRFLFTDDRAVTTTSVRDETWLRLIDVPAALNARTYRGEGSVVVAVQDPIMTANTGSYRISAEGADRVDEPAELSVDVAALAAVYLGGSTWWQLAAAGRTAEHRPGAIAAADTVFRTDTLPFSGTFF